MSASKDAQHYLALPYQQVWEWREDEVEPYWLVRLAEIPQVVGDGPTRAEAEAALRECLVDYVRYRQTEGLPVAEPAPRTAAR
jgi:predicted RNase H-like HicB family nuclease